MAQSTITALDEGSWTEVAWIAGAVVASLIVHVVLAASVSAIPERQHTEPVWIEMAITEVTPPEPPPPEPPPPEPEPEPEPKPEPQKPPEVVDYTPQPEQPQPPPPPEAKPVPRVVQGLNNESFLPGAGTGMQVRAGTTTAVRATEEVMGLEEATESAIVPYASITNPPKVKYKPPLEVPDTVKEAGVEGRVELLLTIDATGKVTEIEVVTPLHPDADAACKDSMSRSRWKPGDKDGTAVVTRNVPYSCRFEMSSR
ncbi:MAG: energy transducer TonB [Alphaproteobacteria bacterium]|nr:energy transducer TonB [Alphaproteobacteria bacterium]